MALATAEGDAPFPHQGVETFGEGEHIGLQLGLAGHPFDLLLGGIGVTKAQVFSQGGGKQIALLGHQGQLTAQVLQAQVGDVLAIYP